MDLFSSLPDAATLLQYFNYGLIAIVAFFAIIGFFRGTYKSLFYMIATAIILVGGWLLMDTVSGALLKYDLSSFNLNLLDVQVTNVEEFVRNIAIANFPGVGGLLTQDTYVASLISGLMIAVVRILYFIVLIVLSFTVFKFITDIFWLIFRPKKKNKLGKKRKKSFLSRLGGFGIGALKGSLYLALLVFPIAGIASIGDSLSQVVDYENDSTQYELVLLGNSATLVGGQTPIDNSLGDLGQIFEILGIYRQSIAGQVYGSIKIKGAGFDEYIFDSLLSFEVAGNKIALREELKTVANAIAKVEGLLEGDFSIETLYSQDPAALKEFIDEISKLKILKIVIPLALEVAILYEDENGKTLLDQVGEGIEISLEDIHSQDYSSDIKNVGYIFVDITQIYDFSGATQTNLLAANPEIVSSIFNSIGDLGIVNLVVPIALAYVTTLADITDVLETYGLTFEDLGFDEIENWGAEIAKFGDIYEAFYNLGISDFAAFTAENPDYETLFAHMSEENINNFTEALFNSLILSKATPVIMGVMINTMLPEDYQSIISFENVTWNATEFSALLNAAVVIMKSNILSISGGTTDLANLTEEMINDLAKYLSKSKVITTNLNGLIQMLLDSTGVLEGAEIEFRLLDEDEWTEEELKAIFNSARVLVTADLVNFTNLEDETIDDLGRYLSKSKFIKINLNEIIKYLLSTAGDLFGDAEIEFVLIADDDWTEDELTNLFHAAKLLAGADFSDFGKIEDDTIDEMAKYLSGSKFITSNLNPILDVFLGDMNLFGEAEIEFVKLEVDDWTEAELTNLFHAAKLLVGADFTNFGEIEDETIDDMAKYLSGSKFITHNLNPILDVFLGDMNLFGEAEIEFVKLEVDDWTEAELTNLFHAAKLLAGTDFTNFGEIEDETIDDMAKYLSGSKFITHNLNPILDVFLGDMNLFGDAEIEFVELEVADWTEAELNNLFHAAKLLSGTDFSAFASVEDKTIDDMAKYLSGSKFITSNLNPILDVFLGDMDLFGDAEIEFVELEVAEWTENELSNLFYAAKLLSSSDMSNIGDLEDDKIEDMSYHMANSQFITRNLNPILDSFLEDMDTGTMELEFGKVDDWSDPARSEKELTAIFKSAKIISNKGNNTEAFLDLSEEELDIFLSSELISKTLVNLLKSSSEEGSELDFLVGVEDPDVLWYDGQLTSAIFSIDANDIMTIIAPANTNKFNIYADGVKLASTRSLTFDLTTLDLEGSSPTWTVSAFFEGELRKIFTAMGALTSSLSGESSFSTDTITNLSDEDIDNIIVSDILVQSIVVLLEDMAAEDDPFIVIPEGDLKSEDSEVKLNAWKNTGSEGISVEGELAKLFKGLRRFLQDNTIESFDMTNVTGLGDDDIYEMLKSEVLSESIIVQLEKQADPEDPDAYLAIPIDVGLDDPQDRSAWHNVYKLDIHGRYVYDEFSHIVVLSDGELTRSLRALKIILDGGDIDNIDIGNFLDETNQNIVLASLVIEETIIKMIEDEAAQPESMITIPYEINEDRSLWKGEFGELRSLLKALDYILGEGGSIKNLDFDLNVVISEKNEIFKSLVIVETVIVKLDEQEDIYFPTGLGYGLVDPTNRAAWRNAYSRNLDGSYKYGLDDKIIITTYGELSMLFDALDIIILPDPITGERSLTSITFDVSELFASENRDTFLKSLVISETIVQKIFDTAQTSDSLYIPGSLYVNTQDDVTAFNRDKWFNVYSNDVRTFRGELDYLLDAADLVLDEGNSFEDISFDIGIAYDPLNQETLLKSLVISETIVQKVFEEASKPDSMLKLPGDDYVNDITTTSNRSKWFSKYENDVLVKTQELAHLLNAASKVVTGDSFEDLNFDLSAAFDEVNQPIILRSFVISETILQKIVEEANSPDSMLSLPPVSYLDDPSSGAREKWYNSYNNDGNLVETNELAHLLKAANILLDGGSFEDLSFDLNAAFDEVNQPIILHSYVMAETILQKIVEEANSPDSMLSLPPVSYLDDPSTTARGKWYNLYDVNGDLVKTNELAHLLKAANILLDGGSFEDLSFDLNAAFDEVNQPIILHSYVMAETILQKIVEEANSPDSMLSLPPVSYLDDPSTTARGKWYNSYNNDGDLVKTNELAHLLKAANILLDGGSFEDLSFDLNAAFDEVNQPIILHSYVMAETILQKIVEEADSPDSMLSLPPVSYLDDPSSGAREKWYNSYNNDGDLVETNELAHLLKAANILLDGGSFEDLSFDLNAAFDEINQPIILHSYVMAETILQRIVEETKNSDSMLSLPPESYLNDPSSGAREKWYNEYADGVLVKTNELAHLLKATNILLNGGSFEDVNFDLSAAFDPAKQDTVLLSYIISETILQRIVDETNNSDSMLYLPPIGFLDDPSSGAREKWYNEYTNGVLVKNNELAHLLNATNILLNGGSFEDVNFDLSAAFDPVKQDTVLLSYIISETILQRIVEETKPNHALYLAPSPYLDDISTANRGTWYNEYVDGVVSTRKEIANLLNATKVILGDKTFEDLETFDISVAFEQTSQALLLKSFIIAETFVQSINNEATSGAFVLPSSTYLDLPDETNDRGTWYNLYDVNGNVLKTNEIAHLLNAASQLLGEGEDFAGMDFPLEDLFDPNKQKTILKSLIFSETIVSKIYDQNGDAINVPKRDLEGNSLNDPANRDPWYNQYAGEDITSYGEIAHMLRATEIILDGHGTFEDMEFSIDTLFNRAKQDEILKSLVLSETIVKKITAEDDTITSVPNLDLQGRPLNDETNRLAWFNDYRDETMKRNELAKFLDAIELIVGESSFEELGEIGVDSILAISFNLVYDEEFYVTTSDFATLVNSVVMEGIIAPLVYEVATDPIYMKNYLTEPDDDYHFYKKDLITAYDLTTFDENLYDLQGFMESLYVMKQAGIDYKDLENVNILDFDESTSQNFAKAMVISRVFKGSIAKMYNELLYPTYDFLPAAIPVSIFPPVIYNKKAWEDVRFEQNDYQNATRKDAYNLLVAKLESFKETIEVNGIIILTAFYEE